jgi:small-conductance mechanosensitive channel
VARRAGVIALALGVASLLASVWLRNADYDGPTVEGFQASAFTSQVLAVLAVALLVYGAYRLAADAIAKRAGSKRRVHTACNVFRFAFGIVGAIAVLGAITEQWVGVLFSLGILGFAITFALQQPLLSVLGWVYVVIKQPYGVGDRVRIGGAKGDVIDVDFLVTTLWEINGELVASQQPSGRAVTVPNSVVLSAEMYNYSCEEFPFVWNELSVQVAYETDLGFARERMQQVADDYLGDEMEARIERYRRVLGKTPVELEVRDRPTVNVRQAESWVELKVRYLVHPRGGSRRETSCTNGSSPSSTSTPTA